MPRRSVPSALSYRIAFTLTGFICAVGLYGGLSSDEWGWVFYAVFTLILGFVLLKRNGTKSQAKTAHRALFILTIVGILVAAAVGLYLWWMNGLTF